MHILCSFHHSLLQFWNHHPSLLYALFLLLGFQIALFQESLLFIPLLGIGLPLLASRNHENWRRLFLGIALIVASIGWTSYVYQFPTLPKEGILGKAHLTIDSVSITSNHFGKRWTYRGTLHLFTNPDGKIIAKRIPYVSHLPAGVEFTRPLADQDYLVEGRLKENHPGRYQLVIRKRTPWYPIPQTWSLAEIRLNAKNAVAHYIQKNISQGRVATFLTGIATGYFDDHLMTLEFSRFGLQHIMAISGFHFAIIAGFFGLLLRLFINREAATALLTLFLSGYFLFLGCSPSVMRAWVSIVVVLLGYLLRRQSSGLNTLGIALLVTLLYDPLFCKHIGFQFSFAATAAILLLYPACDFALQSSFTKRSLSELVEMNRPAQHAYCLLTGFRQAVALTLAVHLITLPMMLYHFERFPLLSLIHNLFFPFLVSVSMILLVLASLVHPFLPPISMVLHKCNSAYTQFVLDFTYKLPKSLDLFWIYSPSLFFLTTYLVIAFLLSIYVRSQIQGGGGKLEVRSQKSVGCWQVNVVSGLFMPFLQNSVFCSTKPSPSLALRTKL